MIHSRNISNKLVTKLFVGSWVVLMLSGTVALAEHYDSPETAVEAGRDSLDQGWGGYPWYDAATDDVRGIDVEVPSAPGKKWDWSWLNFGWIGTLLRIFGWTTLLLLLVCLVWLIVRAFLDAEVSSTRTATTATESDSVTDLDRVEALPFMAQRPQSDLLGEARRHYLDGNFSEAIIYLFSYQLVELDKGQQIRLARGKTNRQYLREVRRETNFGDLLEETMVAFEDVFFGNHPLVRARFESCWNQLDDFHRQLQEVLPA